MIYIPPFGLNKSIDYMLKMDPTTYAITKIKLDVDKSTEKWQNGIVYRNLIYFLPYNESKILIVNTDDDSVDYIELNVTGRGKYIQGHIYGDRIIALPYGEHEPFTFVLDLSMKTHKFRLMSLDITIVDTKMWHTTQMIDGIIYGVPRGESLEEYFPYRIEYDCISMQYKLVDMSDHWLEYNKQPLSNKKYTTMAKVGRKLYAPPYSENSNFDVLLKFDGTQWHSENTGLQLTSRKYYSHTVARNKKIFFPPAGHDEDWSEMLIIDSDTDKWHTINLGIKKESKKYFSGIENSQGKIYYIPRGGCVCEPKDTWKSQGDLAEVLVIDTHTEEYYTVDISDYFKDSTTIEKYNNCVIYNDVVFAFPYGESETFQTLIVFDTISEKVIHTVDLKDV